VTSGGGGMSFEAWLLDWVVCPACAGRLAVVLGGELVACGGCQAAFPVLGDVPVLVADPARYLGAYRDAVLAALAEVGRASRRAVALIDELAATAEPMRFGDDWSDPTTALALPSLAPWLADARAAGGPGAALLELLGHTLGGAVAEVGCGDGALSAALRSRCDPLVVTDWSLRAALRGRAAARRARGGAVAAAVVDAAALPLAPGRFTALVAANVIDLLDDPGAFVRAAARALTVRGRLALATPAPEGVDALLAAAGLAPVAERDPVAWLHAHSSRHLEIYAVRALVASRSRSR
jgi:SAM-dependent methyltransferase/uncharacterized protein YbaR (Trm112 family)